MIRLFVSAPLLQDTEIPATPGQAHYLGAVMRREVDDKLLLFNGKDGEWQARIVMMRKERAIFQVLARVRSQRTDSDLWLLFAPLKRDATDWVVQKATELGVSLIQPVLTERCIVTRINLERLSSIATEAAEQSERMTVPRLCTPRRLPDLLSDWPADRPLAVALERSNAPDMTASGMPRPAGALLIGPEGGFTDAELDLLRLRPFVEPVSLGPLILRAETAAIAGLALLQAQARSCQP